jgi:hypothetical protein
MLLRPVFSRSHIGATRRRTEAYWMQAQARLGLSKSLKNLLERRLAKERVLDYSGLKIRRP